MQSLKMYQSFKALQTEADKPFAQNTIPERFRYFFIPETAVQLPVFAEKRSAGSVILNKDGKRIQKPGVYKFFNGPDYRFLFANHKLFS